MMSFGMDMISHSIEMRNWTQAKKLLKSHLPLLDQGDIQEIFENFLFGLEIIMDQPSYVLEETVNQIIQIFLRSTCIYRSGTEIELRAPHLNTHVPPDVSSTLIHNLCIENKPTALAMLLRNLDADVAATEVQRNAHIRLDYAEETDDQDVYHDLDTLHTPMQAAWAGKLFHKESLDQLNDIHHLNDLNEEWIDLWTTTVYLLLAFDRKPISLDYAASSDWNIIPVISRYGHRNYDAVMVLALKLFPQFAQVFSCDGTLPLHEATKNQICYYPIPRHVESDAPIVSRGGFKGHEFSLVRHQSFDKKRGFPVNFEHNPALLLLSYNASAAFSKDQNGRLPLHIALIHHRRNQGLVQLKECSSYHSTGSYSCDYVLVSSPIIKALVGANPKALECPEPSTGLYPFLFAAKDNTSTLDVVFSLLLCNATVLVDVISSRSTSEISSAEEVLLSASLRKSLTTGRPTHKRKKRVVSPDIWNVNVPSAWKSARLMNFSHN